jgi:hypothetical protein
MAADRVEPGRSDEVAAGQSDHAREDRIRTVEIISAVLLSLATVLAAWSAFQSAKWSGVQATRFSQASALRMESVRASTAAGSQEQVDVTLFAQWVNAYDAGNTRLANFYFERFRAEFKPAVDAWVATKPLSNPHAPSSPFAMPEYKLAKAGQANDLLASAEGRTNLALQANQNSDDYVLLTVLFASTLLFAGLASKFTARAVQTAMSGLALVLLCAGIGFLAAFPRQF